MRKMSRIVESYLESEERRCVGWTTCLLRLVFSDWVKLEFLEGFVWLD